MKKLLIIVAAVFMLTGCKTTTQYVPVTVHTTDTLKMVYERWDSIHIHDSIFTDRTADTVRIERWRTKYIERHTHDTIREVTHDTVPHPYPVEVVKEVEKQLTWWQQARMHIGGITLWAGVLTLFGWVLKKRLRL